MKPPIAVEVHDASAYLSYSNDAVAKTLDLMASCSVAADVSATGEVVGIEVLDITDRKQLEVAREFAREKGLGFPRDLAGALI